ncbi:hypothetical protein [Plasmodium yoelii yoelii]|uniref:Uncharacterized protein n=1 Tax=Plasmodium yoelii yoelii TaxID=73239 RepID=Q7PCQ0_PLAYO|nr:hypothetical protein [Plasmodium yoelii yoelii]EAA19625.1 hypothetical protein [Plasmodium yoelii yoelii]
MNRSNIGIDIERLFQSIDLIQKVNVDLNIINA